MTLQLAHARAGFGEVVHRFRDRRICVRECISVTRPEWNLDLNFGLDQPDALRS